MDKFNVRLALKAIEDEIAHPESVAWEINNAIILKRDKFINLINSLKLAYEKDDLSYEIEPIKKAALILKSIYTQPYASHTDTSVKIKIETAINLITKGLQNTYSEVQFAEIKISKRLKKGGAVKYGNFYYTVHRIIPPKVELSSDNRHFLTINISEIEDIKE